MDARLTLGAKLVVALVGLAHVVCLVALWRSAGSTSRKLAWSVVLLVPALGPMFFVALYDGAPSVQGDVQQAERTSGDETLASFESPSHHD